MMPIAIDYRNRALSFYAVRAGLGINSLSLTSYCSALGVGLLILCHVKSCSAVAFPSE